jgi:death-on-curing protein
MPARGLVNRGKQFDYAIKVTAPSWRWLSEDIVLAIHDAQIAEHGGDAGIRDFALVQSALARPQNRAAYGIPDVADVAAAYAFGIARNHGFVDGNKRTAFVVACVFPLDHGYDLTASDAEAATTMVGAASGAMTETDFAAWIRNVIRPSAPQ